MLFRSLAKRKCLLSRQCALCSQRASPLLLEGAGSLGAILRHPIVVKPQERLQGPLFSLALSTRGNALPLLCSSWSLLMHYSRHNGTDKGKISKNRRSLKVQAIFVSIKNNTIFFPCPKLLLIYYYLAEPSIYQVVLQYMFGEDTKAKYVEQSESYSSSRNIRSRCLKSGLHGRFLTQFNEGILYMVASSSSESSLLTI